MTEEQYLNNLTPPRRKVDVVLDTDTFNEVDDQFALSYLIRSEDRLRPVAINAAPFFNDNSSSPCDGMEKSYDEILKLLDLAERADLKPLVFKGSSDYLPDEGTPIESDAARNLVSLSKNYSPENPLYVVSTGAITNIASALLIDPTISENIVIVWLGGHAHHYKYAKEFNLRQDIAASRVCMSSAAPFVQLPCMGVVEVFSVTEAELVKWLLGKNPLSDYLASYTIDTVNKYALGKPWSRVLWDVTAVAWLIGEEEFMDHDIRNVRLSDYNGYYEDPIDKKMSYVTTVHRDKLVDSLFSKLLIQ